MEPIILNLQSIGLWQPVDELGPSKKKSFKNLPPVKYDTRDWHAMSEPVLVFTTEENETFYICRYFEWGDLLSPNQPDHNASGFYTQNGRRLIRGVTHWAYMIKPENRTVTLKKNL